MDKKWVKNQIKNFRRFTGSEGSAIVRPNGHVTFRCPCGSSIRTGACQGTVGMAGTPSDHRSHANAKAALKRLCCGYNPDKTF